MHKFLSILLLAVFVAGAVGISQQEQDVLEIEATGPVILAELEAYVDQYMEDSQPEFAAFIEETIPKTNVAAEESLAETSAEAEAEDAPAAPAPAAVTPVPAPTLDANGAPVAPAASEPPKHPLEAVVPVDATDKAILMNIIMHDGRYGAVKPILVPRRGDTEAILSVETLAAAEAKKSAEWAQRAADEQRLTEATEQAYLKAIGKLPPVEKFVIATNGPMAPGSAFVPAGSDMQQVGIAAGCNSTIVNAPLK